MQKDNQTNEFPNQLWELVSTCPLKNQQEKEVKQRLFDPFFSTKPIAKGTDMGLSISYQIISQKHGGSLECISQPGSGAEFIISIPLSQKEISVFIP